MNNNTNFGKDFINKVLPRLTPDEQIGLFDYTSKIEQQGEMKAKQTSHSLNARRKQDVVETIYNGGQLNMQGMQPTVPPMGAK